MSRRLTAAAQRKRRLDRLGLTLIGFVAAFTIGFGWMAVAIDRAHGISVSQSLHNAGL